VLRKIFEHERNSTRLKKIIQGVPLATEPGISLIILPLMRISQRNLKRTTDTFLLISHTPNALLFKFRCNIFIGVRIIQEMPGSVTSGTFCIMIPHFPKYFSGCEMKEDGLGVCHVREGRECIQGVGG